jgi:hypothetical protein
MYGTRVRVSHNMLAIEYENKLLSCYFEAYSRLFSYLLFLITVMWVRLVLTELEGHI